MNLKTAANNLARLIEQGGLEAIDEHYNKYDNKSFPKLIRQAIRDVDEAPDSPPLAWDAAVDAAARKAMVVQDGFRKLLKEARQSLIDGSSPTSARRFNEAAVDQGEAIVGTLGDVIRNIAALRGQYPR